MATPFATTACAPVDRFASARAAATTRRAISITPQRLADMPGIGLAGAYAGASNGFVLVAGGTNFPDRMPWQGGRKVWTDDVYAWSPGGAWRIVGKLPRPAAGGSAVTTHLGVLCAGGSDAGEVFRDVFLLRFENGQLVREPLPPLPMPLAGSAAAVVGTKVFIFGGHSQTNPLAGEPSRALLSIDLSGQERRWVEHPPLPGPGRYLSVLATDAGSLYVFSGMRPGAGSSGAPGIRFLRDAYRYTPGRTPADGTWQQLPDLPRSFAAAPSPAPVVDGCAVFLGGGVDELDIVAPMDRRGDLDAGIVSYDLATGQARQIGRGPVSVVVAPTIPWRDGVIVASGEIRAGIRTPQVWWYR